ncbi:UPF0187 protein like [Verticillium longisporum]|uniref:UPF0187 protein like n=1 Tax=Verticillium longisporum TaxID=100787 RepID=A0A8I2ZYG2_VERLO|nr:UPF0187 protein like [Verticillium longisporum]
MADDGAPAASGAGGHGAGHGAAATAAASNSDHTQFNRDTQEKRINMPPALNLTEVTSPVYPETPNYFSRKNTSVDVEDYFTGPRDIQKHSKWPFVLQMHGSILPRLLVPLIIVTIWSTLITCLSKFVYNLGVQSILLTVLGFVVGLGLSFRSSTAYERYAEGRRYWAQLIHVSQTLGRVFWIHAKEHPELAKKDMMLRRVSCLNLVLAFSVALKHKLRFEPYTVYEDLQHLVGHLNTFAKTAAATDPQCTTLPKKNFFKEVGEYLGVSFAESNPRKALKKATYPLGNLPLEIISHLSVIVDAMVADGQLPVPMQQTTASPGKALEWITIPACIAASYIILAILFIGKEIENPFGRDVNDLPLEGYCEQIAHELDVIAAMDVHRDMPYAFLDSHLNLPLYPVSMASFPVWAERSEEKIRTAIQGKPVTLFQSRKKSSAEREKEEIEHRKAREGSNVSSKHQGDNIV